MREIKFRAWDKLDRVMNTDLPTIDFECCKINGLILMQYTGLKDKNGKEIYEGDIVHHLKYGGNWEVIYTKENTGYDLKRDNHESMHLCDKCQPNLEIVGNIYENPELVSP